MVDSYDVFDLRDEGNLEEALQKGRECYEANPNDIWAKRALGWTLYDLIKQKLDAGDVGAAREYIDEFDELGIPEDDDELIHDKVGQLRQQTTSSALREAKKASRSEDYKKAVRLFRKARNQTSADGNFLTENGWALRNHIRELIQQDQPPIGLLDRLFREFKSVQPPHSQKLYDSILYDAVKIAENWRGYNDFLYWWNPDNFRVEHFKPDRTQSGTYPGLAYKAARAGAKRVVKDQDDESAEWLLPFLKRIVERGAEEDELWIHYDIGRVANLIDDNATAREHLAQVVREKYTESWAWGHLADSFSDTDDRKAALCAALDGAPNDSFVLSIREELAEVLVSEESYSQAKREVLNIVEVRQAEGYDFPERVKQWKSSEWFEEVKAPESNQSLYEAHADRARELVLEDIPWVDGVVTGHQEKNDKGPARTFIGVSSGKGSFSDIPVRDENHSLLGDLDQGAPVKVRAERSSQTIFDVKRRKGDEWDLLEMEVAVVDHVNEESEVTHIVTSSTRHGLAYHDSVPGSDKFEPGDYVKVRSVKGRQDRPERIVDIEKTEEVPPETINQSIEGYFSFPHDGRTHFGFVQDCYVPEELIETYDLSDRQKVRGRAILSQPDEDDWQVVEIYETGSDSRA